LRNIVERLLILATDDAAGAISADLLPSHFNGSGSPWAQGAKPDLIISLPLREAREIFEREYLLAQINRFGGNISRTASFIGMQRSALHRKLKSLGVSSARLEQAFNAWGVLGSRCFLGGVFSGAPSPPSPAPTPLLGKNSALPR